MIGYLLQEEARSELVLTNSASNKKGKGRSEVKMGHREGIYKQNG